MTKHPFHMTQAELDALSPEDRARARVLIDDVVFGHAADRAYLDGDYDQVSPLYRRHELGD